MTGRSALLAGFAIMSAQAAFADGHPNETLRPVVRPVAILAGEATSELGKAFDAAFTGTFDIEPGQQIEVSFSGSDFGLDDAFMTIVDMRDYTLPGKGKKVDTRDPQVIKLAGELETVIVEHLQAGHDLINGRAGDVDRLFDLAEGVAFSDWGAPAAHLTALQVTDAKFEAAAPAAVVDTTAESINDMRRFLATPEGMSALTLMSPQQIEALAQVMANQAAPVAQTVTVAQASVPAPAPEMTSGVPPLDFSNDAQDVQDDRILGGTTDLLLRDWRIAQEGAATSMFLVNNPGSRIDVREGMVLGALGEIVAINFNDYEVTVTFDNGETLTGEVS
jgi:hypothetical protein